MTRVVTVVVAVEWDGQREMAKIRTELAPSDVLDDALAASTASAVRLLQAQCDARFSAMIEQDMEDRSLWEEGSQA